MRNLDWEGKGLKINGKILNYPRFADDIVLISGNRQELQEMLDGLCTEGEKAELEINFSKTKIISNSEGRDLVVRGTELQVVENYTYLGQIVTFREKMKKEIEARIRQAWKGYWALKLSLIHI